MLKSAERMMTDLARRGTFITEDRNEVGAYVVQTRYDDVVTSVRITLEDYCGADLLFTNMTTYPVSEVGRGYGSRAVQEIISWAKTNRLKDIRATQIATVENERFWIKNGFVKMPPPNPTNDFQYIHAGR